MIIPTIPYSKRVRFLFTWLASVFPIPKVEISALSGTKERGE